MPELPEVQTIKSQLEEILPMKVKNVDLSSVASSIIKSKDFPLETFNIDKIERQGKVLRFFLNNKRRIISGLGMSGSWRISKERITEKHTHIQFCGTNKFGKIYLGYIDPRRFGVMYFFNEENENEWLKRLGPDVSTEDFSLSYLIHLKKTKPEKIIKPFMLDQKYFAGVGNYMASEICARAGVRPTRRMKTLTQKDLKNILKATRDILSDTINTGGTTFSGGYQDAYGGKGEGVKHLLVFYQKVCLICHETDVKKIELAGRGTYYCPLCQK